MKKIEQNENNYSLKNKNKMRRLALLVCLLIGTVAAHAQFEKGKWFVNPSITGLNLSYNTETDKRISALKPKAVRF